jgi:hypothetical protein
MFKIPIIWNLFFGYYLSFGCCYLVFLIDYSFAYFKGRDTGETVSGHSIDRHEALCASPSLLSPSRESSQM